MSMIVQPLLFKPAYEQIPDDEQHTLEELQRALAAIQHTTLAEEGQALRSVHAKAHGLLRGELKVMEGLSHILAQGLFANPATYPVFMRFSTNPGDVLDDHVSTPRGLAIKVDGVEGQRLPGSEAQTSQDFVMVNAQAFNAPDPKAFLKSLQLLAKTTDKAPGMKRALSAVLRGVEAAVEALGGESATVKSMGGHPITHVLGETYSSLVPLLYGPYFAKVRVVPVSAALLQLTDQPVELDGDPDGLRAAVRQFFLGNGAVWEVQVQLATDVEKMPIEDASIVWPEALSPFMPVAHIHVPQQDAWSAENQQSIDQCGSFSPWHGLAAHRPLGSIMRVRKSTYERSAGFRQQHAGCPLHPPRA
jgi:hypothetical protein